MTVWLLIALAVLAGSLALGFVLARGRAQAHSWKELSALAEPVSLDAFRSLLAPQQEEFLRTHLPESEYRRLNRKRLGLAVRYLRAIAHNAGLLVRIGEAARSSADPEVRRVAGELVVSGVLVRLQVLALAAQLAGHLVFPSTAEKLRRMEGEYHSLTERFARLLSLQEPAAVGQALSYLT